MDVLSEAPLIRRGSDAFRGTRSLHADPQRVPGRSKIRPAVRQGSRYVARASRARPSQELLRSPAERAGYRRLPNFRWRIGGLLGVGVLINYFDRIGLSVAAPQLQEIFHLTPADLGLLFSAFFWSYALLQIPTGLVLDYFGVTRV